MPQILAIRLAQKERVHTIIVVREKVPRVRRDRIGINPAKLGSAENHLAVIALGVSLLDGRAHEVRRIGARLRRPYLIGSTGDLLLQSRRGRCGAHSHRDAHERYRQNHCHKTLQSLLLLRRNRSAHPHKTGDALASPPNSKPKCRFIVAKSRSTGAKLPAVAPHQHIAYTLCPQGLTSPCAKVEAMTNRRITERSHRRGAALTMLERPRKCVCCSRSQKNRTWRRHGFDIRAPSGNHFPCSV